MISTAGEVNDLKSVPLGMVTHHASSITAPTFHTKVVNHYYHFSSAAPHWKVSFKVGQLREAVCSVIKIHSLRREKSREKRVLKV